MTTQTTDEDVEFIIMGSAEAAEYLEDRTGQSWDSKKIHKYLSRSRERGNPPGSFPEPDVILQCGGIWLQTTIDDYILSKQG
ncbi:hypothetical protein ERTO105960_09320 [Erysipelothrix tonsillarum]